MNLPNKLTVLRIAMIPLFLVFMLISPETFGATYLIALAVFALASLTDMLDGKIARKHGLITDFGKLMDPLADKLLVMSALVAFVELGWVPGVVVIIILAREFLVTSVRLIAAGKGTVLAADKWGKMKTVSQMIWIIYLLFAQWLMGMIVSNGIGGFLYVIHYVLMALVVFLTLFSGFNYMKNNWELFADA